MSATSAFRSGGALLFDAVTFAISVVCLVPLRPRLVREGMGGDARQTATDHFLRSLREGWTDVRGRAWVVAFLGGMASYHAIVLPAIFVLGPVLVNDELGGAKDWAIITAGFGIGSILGDFLLLHWRPRYALRVAALMLMGAWCQAAFIGSGLGVWAIAGFEVLAGVCVTGCFTLWEIALQEHVPAHVLSRVSSYDYLTSAGLIPLGNLLSGVAVTAIGLHESLLAMTALGITAGLAVVAVPAVRHLPRGTIASI